MKIGHFRLSGIPVVLAPMAGVTDQPFRNLCRHLGASMAVSEMLSSDKSLWNTRKSKLRFSHDGEPEPRAVQIAGNDPLMMAKAARRCVAHGAQIIDINMGCPAKKVCKKAAGSALLKDEPLVKAIIEAVVNAVNAPVTLKMRTGWSPEQRNGVSIARIAEDLGIQSIAVHGRTRACGYRGDAEYETIARIKQAVSIPVLANGDITTPEKAKEVLDQTAVDGIMIGRAAQGNPWIFQQVSHFLETGDKLAPPKVDEVRQVMLNHLVELHRFYGEHQGVRIARKHMGWYVQNRPGGADFRQLFNQLDSASDQLASAQDYFEHLIEGEVMAA